MKLKMFLIHLCALLYGLAIETHMWNMVMPKVFGLPSITYLQMFLAGLAIRFIVSQDYTTTILWGRYISPMTPDQKEAAVLHRYNLYFGGQTLGFLIIWGIVKVCL